MSKAPFSKPDVNDVVSSSHVFKIRSSLNHWSRRMLPESRGKHLFGIVVIALLVLGLQLTACGNAATSNNGPASPTSNPTSQPNTPPTTSGPGSTSTTGSTTGPTTGPTKNPTAGSTTGPTTGPTVVPIADPSSFTISLFGFSATGAVGQGNINLDKVSRDEGVITLTNKSTTGSIAWSATITTTDGGNWLGLSSTHSGKLLPNSPPENHRITLFISNTMKPGTYTGCIVFTPPQLQDNCQNPSTDKKEVPVTLQVLPKPIVTSINPNHGPVGGGTAVTISGSGFTNATAVSFGSAVVNNPTVNSDGTQMTVTSPPGNGTVHVQVTTPVGTSDTGAGDQFTYDTPVADPSSFTVSIQQFTPSAMAGQTSVLKQTITLTNDSQSGVINWSVSISTNDGGGWLSFSPGSGTLQPNTSKDYQITVTVSKDMPAGTYHGTVQFNPNSTNNVVAVDLTITP